MKKKTTVVLMILLLCLSVMLAGCRNRDDAGTGGLNDGLYNDNTGNEIMDDIENAGEDIKDGVKDVIDGTDSAKIR